MEEKSLKELINNELKYAKDRLHAAEILFENNKLIDAIDRAYYAVFHASKALLYSIGKEARTHSGTISMLGLYLIERGKLDKRYGVILRRLFEARETANCVLGAIFEREEIKEMIANAKLFLKEAEKLSKENLKKYEKNKKTGWVRSHPSLLNNSLFSTQG